jgi:hypothetical protein
VAGRVLVPEALQDGFVAATNAVQGNTMPLEKRVSPAGSFTEPEYASVGLTEKKARETQDVVTAIIHFDSTIRLLNRVAIETILGFQLRGGELRFEPCMPPNWPWFELTYRHRSATYRILVDNSAGTGRGVRSVELDGQRLPNDTIPLVDDSKSHEVRVQLG